MTIITLTQVSYLTALSRRIQYVLEPSSRRTLEQQLPLMPLLQVYKVVLLQMKIGLCASAKHLVCY